MRRLLVLNLVVVVMLLGVPASPASQVSPPGATVIDFEGFPCWTSITNQYAGLGVAFTGADILVVGGCLNSNYPPQSGTGVVYDGAGSGGVVTASFSQPVARAGGYVTGNTAVTLECFDASNTSLGTASTPGANSLPNGTPNIFLEVVSPGIHGCAFSDSGNTFTVDDFSFVTMIGQLQTRIADLAGSGELTAQVSSRLDGLLDTASEYLAGVATQGACRSLTQFRAVVHRSQLQGLLSYDLAQELTTSASDIQDALSC